MFIASLSMPAIAQQISTQDNEYNAKKVLDSLTELPASLQAVLSNKNISPEEKDDITLMVEKLLKTLDEHNKPNTSQTARDGEKWYKGRRLEPVKVTDDNCKCPF